MVGAALMAHWPVASPDSMQLPITSSQWPICNTCLPVCLGTQSQPAPLTSLISPLSSLPSYLSPLISPLFHILVLHGSNRIEELLHRGITIRRVGLNALVDGFLEFRMNLWVVLVERRRLGLPVTHRGQAVGAALPRQREGEHFIHRNAEGKDIEALIGWLSANDFGGHVVGRSGPNAGLHKFASRGHGEAEVDQLERRRVF